MDILRTKVKKIIVEFKIGSLEYPYASSFILNKTFSSFGTKIVQKSKSPSTLIWVNVKQFNQFWVIVGHSRSIQPIYIYTYLYICLTCISLNKILEKILVSLELPMFFFFLHSVLQNHFCFGTRLSPTHLQWNHYFSQFELPPPIKGRSLAAAIKFPIIFRVRFQFPCHYLR